MNNPLLVVKTKTWLKDSHSLFDYETEKIQQQLFETDAVGAINIYRKKNGSSLKLVRDYQTIDKNVYDFLTQFSMKKHPENDSIKLKFRKQNSKPSLKHERVNTDQSNQGSQPKQGTYMVVSKFKDHEIGTPLGVKLSAGQTVKLGRVQYFVSQISLGGLVDFATSRSKNSICNRGILNFNNSHKKIQGNACKICLDDAETEENFLMTPCKCSGSCGTVHIGCLQQWIKIKVKKQIVGGTIHFNFQKFECEVCKSQFPMVIDRNSKHVQLLPLQKPKGSYMILQAACQKTKSVMLLQNLGENGIKLGRGHECQIRITDISVSRNHALIKLKPDGFYIFDNKSKFGTLVRQDNFDLDIISRQDNKAIQVGRTLIEFDFLKKRFY